MYHGAVSRIFMIVEDIDGGDRRRVGAGAGPRQGALEARSAGGVGILEVGFFGLMAQASG